ncbi:MAG: twin-arginine translocation signal domain-containing protein, partial [Bryobacteraceae bacterium]
MNRRHFLGALSAVPLAGAPGPDASQAAPSDGLVPLFNGRDLEGWTITEGPESAFSVFDGAIVVNDSASYPTWLR